MHIDYSTTRKPTVSEFAAVLNRSSLGARRPVDDVARMAKMLEHANLICTAWDGALLVGVARSLTDFTYCCYLSDLAVDKAYQRKGIGRSLIALTRDQLHPEAKLILLAAPAARDYYPHLGMEQHPSAWFIDGSALLR